jgi:hypothetical protein
VEQLQPAPIPDWQPKTSSIKRSIKGRAFSYGLPLRYGHAGVQQEFVNGVFVFRELPGEPDPAPRGRPTEMPRSTAEAIGCGSSQKRQEIRVPAQVVPMPAVCQQPLRCCPLRQRRRFMQCPRHREYASVRRPRRSVDAQRTQNQHKHE